MQLRTFKCQRAIEKGTSELAAGAFVATFFAGDADSAEYGFACFSAPPQAAFFNENGIFARMRGAGGEEFELNAVRCICSAESPAIQ